MKLTFLGTSAQVPTKDRNVAGVFLKYKTQGILFDCGEGTQRQMNIAGINRLDVTKILLSHWHGDHSIGIIGLLQTIGSTEKPVKVEIFGPKETKKRMEHLFNAFIFDNKVELIIKDLNPKAKTKFYETDEYYLECAPLSHKTPCIGFTFVEKDRQNINKAAMKKYEIPEGPHMKKLKQGKTITINGKKIEPKQIIKITKGRKIAYIADTRPCKACYDLAQDADILIAESTYISNLKDKAEKYKHLTAQEAAQIASTANAKKLYLTHFSQRYKSTQEIEEDARVIFDQSFCARDFLKIKL